MMRGSNIANRVTRLRPILVAFVLSIVTTSIQTQAQTRPPIVEQIAKTYGVDSWGQIEAIRYTWNGEITGLLKASRTWERERKTGKVTFEGKDKDGKPVKVTYTSSEIKALAAVFRHGGDKKPSLITSTWTGYKKAGPLLISTEHRGTADGKSLHLFISDVAVKVMGSDRWVEAK